MPSTVIQSKCTNARCCKTFLMSILLDEKGSQSIWTLSHDYFLRFLLLWTQYFEGIVIPCIYMVYDFILLLNNRTKRENELECHLIHCHENTFHSCNLNGILIRDPDICITSHVEEKVTCSSRLFLLCFSLYQKTVW